MEVAKNNNIQSVLFLLSTCIFPEKANLPLNVNDLHDGEPHPSNFAYAFSKRMIDIGSRALKKQYGINTSCLIPCNLYGEYDKYGDNSHFIAALIKKIHNAKINNHNDLP
jgi:GDP-L-fucose synthase